MKYVLGGVNLSVVWEMEAYWNEEERLFEGAFGDTSGIARNGRNEITVGRLKSTSVVAVVGIWYGCEELPYNLCENKTEVLEWDAIINTAVGRIGTGHLDMKTVMNYVFGWAMGLGEVPMGCHYSIVYDEIREGDEKWEIDGASEKCFRILEG